jgi:hypothetical protein
MPFSTTHQHHRITSNAPLHTRPRNILLTALATLTVVGALGCGSAGSDEVVASVTGVGTITKGSLDHWTHVEFILLHEYIPKRPVPKGVIPDPPSYTNCITLLRHTAQQENQPTPSPSTLKNKCAQTEHEMRANTLTKLITWDWTIGRAHALGIHLNNTQLHQQLTAVLNAHTLYGTNLNQYLKYTTQTMTDILYRSRIQYYEEALNNKRKQALATMPNTLTETQKQIAYLNLTHQYTATHGWVTKTSCHKNYLVPACKQYTGPEPPPN